MEHALDLGRFLSEVWTAAVAVAVSSCFETAAPESAPLEVSLDNHDLFSGTVAASVADATAASPSDDWDEDDLFGSSSAAAASLIPSSPFDLRKVTVFLGRRACS